MNDYSEIQKRVQKDIRRIPTYIDGKIERHKLCFILYTELIKDIDYLISDRILTKYNIEIIYRDIENTLDEIIDIDAELGLYLYAEIINNLIEYIQICQKNELYETLANLTIFKDFIKNYIYDENKI